MRKDALYVKIGDLHIGEITEMTIGHARTFFDELKITEFEQSVAGQILYENQKTPEISRIGKTGRLAGRKRTKREEGFCLQT